MIDMIGLDENELTILSEFLLNDELTAEELKENGIINPSEKLEKLKEKGFIINTKWDYEGNHYKANIPKLLKEGIWKKRNNRLQTGWIPFKRNFILGLDVPTEKGLMSLFKDLDKIKNPEIRKDSIKMIAGDLYHYFVETKEGFLTEEQSIRRKKQLNKEKSRLD